MVPRRKFIVFLFVAVLSGCASMAPDESLRPKQLREPVSEPAPLQASREPDHGKLPARAVRTPTVSSPERVAGLKQFADVEPEKLAELGPFNVNLLSVRLPAFINEVFGNLLGLSFQLSDPLANKTDLVTLRSAEPLGGLELYRLALRVLEDYGVAVRYRDGLATFVSSEKAYTEEPPLLVSGLALPSVPVSHRPVYQLVPLKVVRNNRVASMLRNLYGDQKLKIQENPDRNAIVLVGPAQIVSQAVEAVQVLDQPLMRGQNSVRLRARFLDVTTLVNRLKDILGAEGYDVTVGAGSGSLALVPIPENNSIIVFAPDADQLNHVQSWVEALDEPDPRTTGRKGLYFYSVRNTLADQLSETLSGLLDIVVEKQEGQAKTPVRPGGERQLVVDAHNNALIFQGTGEEWQRLLPILEKMDRPSKMVLVQTTIAEVTLTDTLELGVEWALKNVGLGDLDDKLSTVGGLGIGSSGLNYVGLDGGETRLLINAFASDNRVKVLASPHLMVQSGKDASINVGTDVPILTSSTTSQDLTNADNVVVAQDIQYQKTGVQLTIHPVVHSSDRVDIQISKALSKAEPTTTSQINSPSIFTREIRTSLTLPDGGSVLLGGLISNDRSNDVRKVPILGDLPIVGNLFKAESTRDVRTELLVIINPYIISNENEASEITESFVKGLSVDIGAQLPKRGD